MATDMKSILEARTRPHRLSALVIAAFWVVAIILVVRWSLLHSRFDLRPLKMAAFSPLPANDVRKHLCPEVEARMEDVFSRLRRLPHSCLSFGRNFPSLGGSGCPCPCTNGTRSFSAAFSAAASAWPPPFVEKMRHAVRLLEGFGALARQEVSSRSVGLRLPLLQLCCVPSAQAAQVQAALAAFPWQPLRVNFSRMVCAVAGPEARVAVLLLADLPSRQRLLALAAEVEQALALRGVQAGILQAQLQEHHVLLAEVEGALFPVQLALGSVNTAIPPFSWAPGGMEVLQATCRECEEAAGKEGGG